MKPCKQPKRTPEEARSFARVSLNNAARAMAELQEDGRCNGACTAYADIFTYARWRDQGYHVRRGEHGAKLSIIIDTEKEDDSGNVKAEKRFWYTTVFCRCQVDAIASSNKSR